jgi:hypothetical protein
MSNNDNIKQYSADEIVQMLKPDVDSLRQQIKELTHTLHQVIEHGVPGAMYPGSYQQKLDQYVEDLENMLLRVNETYDKTFNEQLNKIKALEEINAEQSRLIRAYTE